MKVKNSKGQTGKLLTDSDTVTVSFSKEKTVYDRDSIESVSITNESLAIPSVGLAASIVTIILAILIDFQSLVSFDNQFVDISGLLAGVGLIILLSGIVGLVYTGYKTFMAYQYNNILVIKGVSGDTHKLQIPKNTDLELKNFL